jgi:hypothetical protein
VTSTGQHNQARRRIKARCIKARRRIGRRNNRAPDRIGRHNNRGFLPARGRISPVPRRNRQLRSYLRRSCDRRTSR